MKAFLIGEGFFFDPAKPESEVVLLYRYEKFQRAVT